MIERMRRRGELVMLLLAGAVVAGAYVVATLGRTASVPADIGPFLVLVLVLFAGAHIAIRKLAPGADGTLLPLAVLLNGVGYVFIARLREDLAAKQAGWIFLGLVAFVVTLAVVRRPRDLERYRYIALFVGVGLVMVPLVPVLGQTINGARIWIRLGPAQFQPGEFAKLFLALFFAAYLVEKRELLALASWPRRRPILPDPKHLGPVLVAWGIAVVVITAERDLGTALLFFALFIVLLWVATGRAGYLLVGAGSFALAAFASWTLFSHVQDRVTNWINPWADPLGGGYQIIQGWYALADGGVAGQGLGLGLSGAPPGCDPAQGACDGRLPEAQNDFIFAVIGEELGLIGSAAVIAAFVLLVGTGLRIAASQEGAFEKLLATGLTTLLGVQTLIILGGVTRLLPLTGVALPFVSYGGTSVVANYVLLALLVRLSDDAHQRRQRKARRVGALAGAG
ncbi:FtsW/RodA/SpoVE family cell cycle protein [Iamia majanohamensis]|uniref:FtsW/RodA/SpoVE family cell cycle protein n=1 Tax=Iamia majanohamensis TaxID=467976 RepID=A0AAF0BW86_9ACTN|nr:FtsW/RodA/SpoVE family cell cycle protein [Iamia majanohamensis]WCO67149.1 FtsW/RodA/SpoVE family cell cycle protein [Iamia majanohamensis]